MGDPSEPGGHWSKTSGFREGIGLPMTVGAFLPEGPLDILVIDDSKYIRTFMRIHLQEAGYAVQEVDPTSLFEVLAAVHTHRPALVITDYEMPLCNGETIVRGIREDAAIRDTPILVVTSHREAELVERLGRWNLLGYLLKPLAPEILVDTVHQFFRQRPTREPNN